MQDTTSSHGQRIGAGDRSNLQGHVPFKFSIKTLSHLARGHEPAFPTGKRGRVDAEDHL